MLTRIMLKPERKALCAVVSMYGDAVEPSMPCHMTSVGCSTRFACQRQRASTRLPGSTANKIAQGVVLKIIDVRLIKDCVVAQSPLRLQAFGIFRGQSVDD